MGMVSRQNNDLGNKNNHRTIDKSGNQWPKSDNAYEKYKAIAEKTSQHTRNHGRKHSKPLQYKQRSANNTTQCYGSN